MYLVEIPITKTNTDTNGEDARAVFFLRSSETEKGKRREKENFCNALLLRTDRTCLSSAMHNTHVLRGNLKRVNKTTARRWRRR